MTDTTPDSAMQLKLTSTADIRHFMRLYTASAALNAALELGLFQHLADEPIAADRVAEQIAMPAHRCRCWLELLTGLGLLERRNDVYAISPAARHSILDAYSHDTWAFLAREARERWPAGHDLAAHITADQSVWVSQGIEAPDYFAAMVASPDRARGFTRMLMELHRPLSEKLADALNMSGVLRLMDLGGGSGVISHALLRRHEQLTAVVVDIEPVCVAGREIAAELGLADRLSFQAANFFDDDLPGGFDAILQCDVAIHTESIYKRLRESLKPDGRLIVIDWFRDPNSEPTLQYRVNAFLGALCGSSDTAPTLDDVIHQLAQAGYSQVDVRMLDDPALHEVRGMPGPAIIEARL